MSERLDFQGNIITSLDENTVAQIAERLEGEGIESLAIVFLFSFVNPAHEQRAAQIVRALAPRVFLTLSSDILPEYREFERVATTAITAYVQPPVARYLSSLSEQLPQTPLAVMQSSGGVIGVEKAASQAARLVFSGPAGGVVGAFQVARQAIAAEPQIITFDRGGTSTDVSLCPGRIDFTGESYIAGLPLRLAAVNLHTVGAGPLHACDLTTALSIKQILIPLYPGTLSALGMLLADVIHDEVQAILQPLDELLNNGALKNWTADLSRRALNFIGENARLDYALVLRYRGQSYEITVPLNVEGDVITNAAEAFHNEHQKRYGHAHREQPIEAVTLRLRASRPGALCELPKPILPTKTPSPCGQKLVWCDDNAPLKTLCYQRAALPRDYEIGGPALIFQFDTTIFIAPNWIARVDEFGNLLLLKEPRINTEKHG